MQHLVQPRISVNTNNIFVVLGDAHREVSLQICINVLSNGSLYDYAVVYFFSCFITSLLMAGKSHCIEGIFPRAVLNKESIKRTATVSALFTSFSGTQASLP